MNQPPKYIFVAIDGEWHVGRRTFLRIFAGQSDITLIPVTETVSILLTIPGRSIRAWQMIENIPIGNHYFTAIYLINSSDTDRVSIVDKIESKNWLRETVKWETEGYISYLRKADFYFPLIFVANKQDLPDAQSPESIRSILNIPDHIPVLPCVATQRDSVKLVLVSVLKLLPQDDIVQQAIAVVEAL